MDFNLINVTDSSNSVIHPLYKTEIKKNGQIELLKFFNKGLEKKVR